MIPADRPLRIAMNGVTGRMGYRQHLLRSILAIRDEGALVLDGNRIEVVPVLVGRNPAKLKDIADRHQIAEWTTDVDAVLGDDSIPIYFDAQTTARRPEALRAAMAAGKHIFTEKPTAPDLDTAVELARLAQASNVIVGVVHDKLYLPGLRKLRRLVDLGFFGHIHSMKGDFGYWVFEGDTQPAQRPSWNYRAEDGGGMVVDMFCHWNYVIEGILGPVRNVYAQTATHIPTRWDETGRPYPATADDAAYAVFGVEGGITVQMNSSWATRVHRDELVEFQVDGSEGSAVAGLFDCVAQHRSATPKAVWNPDLPNTHRYREDWLPVPDNTEFDNAFKAQWLEFLGDVAADRPHRFDLLSAARGVQLAELGLAASERGRRLDVPEISL